MPSNRRQNQKTSSGNFSTEIFGKTGKTNIPMKTSTGSQYIDVNGTPQAVMAIPKSNKSVTGLYFFLIISSSSSSSASLLLLLLSTPLTLIRNILSKRLNIVSPFLNLLLMYRKL